MGVAIVASGANLFAVSIKPVGTGRRASRKFTRRQPSEAEQARRTAKLAEINDLRRKLGYL